MNAARVVVSLLVLLLPAGLAAQGLGDAAARERSRRTKPPSEGPGRLSGDKPATEGRKDSSNEAPKGVAPPADEKASKNESAGSPATPAAVDGTSRPAATSPPDAGSSEPTPPEPGPATVVESRVEEPQLDPTPLVSQEPREPPAPARPELLRPKGEPFAVRWHGVELHARFLGRAFSDSAEGTNETDFEVEDIRFDLRWRPRPWVRAVLEADLSQAVNRWFDISEYHLKDAFLEFRPGRFRIRAGQFKSPISPIELESPWDVPVAERGLLSDVLRFSYGIAGRKPGLELRWNQKAGPLAAVAAVQRATSTRGGRIGDESFDNVAKDWGALTTTARLAWEGKSLELGGVFDLRPAEPLPGEGYERFWTAGADLSWRTKSRAGARLWAEGYVGSSWQDANAFDGDSTKFLAGRVLGAWSFFLQERRSLYVEPFAMAALVEPDTTVREDLIWEASGGFHLGAFGHLRLVLEAQRRGVSRNAPASLGLAPAGGPPMRSRTRLVVQIGAAF